MLSPAVSATQSYAELGRTGVVRTVLLSPSLPQAAAGPIYSLLAIRCSTSAFVSEPDGRNEKHSMMSAGFCWKWLSTERRTVSASAADGFLS